MNKPKILKLSELAATVSKIELITGQVIHIHPVTRRLTLDSGGMLDSGTYIMKDGTNFVVDTSQRVAVAPVEALSKPELTPGQQRLASLRRFVAMGASSQIFSRKK